MIKYIDGDNYNRIFICTDIHGCYTAFMQKLQELGFDLKKDLVICSGDLVDRGKENVKCVELIDKPWFESIKGNHESFCIEGVNDSYIRQIHSIPNNGGSWLYDLSETTQQNIAAQLDSIPYLIELSFKGKKYGFVHADPIVSDWNELKELVENNYTVGSRNIRDSILWTRRLATYEEHDEHPHITGIDMIYLGHTVLEKPKQIGNCRFIDTGAVFGYEFTIEILS